MTSHTKAKASNAKTTKKVTRFPTNTNHVTVLEFQVWLAPSEQELFKVRDIDLSSNGQQQQAYGWNRMSHDYNNHLAQMMRTTSILTDVPHYPIVHNLVKNKAVTFKKKVHIAEQEQEQEKTIICNNSGEVEESIDIDADADSFIQQKYKAYELCKWTTFKRAR